MKQFCAAIVIALAMFSQAAKAELVQESEFSVHLPVTWGEIPVEVLNALRAEMARQSPGAQVPVYQYGFQLANPKAWLEYPYVLVSISYGGRLSGNELQALPKFSSDQSAAENFKALLTDSNIGKMQYDESVKAIWLASRSSIPDVGEVINLSGLIPTEKGLLQFHSYSDAASFDHFAPLFRQLVASVRVSGRLVYQVHDDEKPSGDQSAGVAIWQRVGGKATIGAILVGFVALVLVLARRKRQAPDSTSS